MEACAKKRKHSIETDSDELNQDYEQPVEEVEEPEETFEEFLETVMSELIFDSALKAHFEAKHMADEDDEEEPEPVLVIPRIKQFNQNVTCSNCSALVSAVRFAMHLERCMNLVSSRLANKPKNLYVEAPWHKPKKAKKGKKAAKKPKKNLKRKR